MPLSTQRAKFPIREVTVFALLGAMMFLSRVVMQWIPNVHLLGLFIGAMTLTYRVRALIPLYVYVLLEGVFAGFSPWWMPNLYIWLPLWGLFMLAGKIKRPSRIQVPLYMVLCGLHGLSFGLLYAPAQALLFGLNFKAMPAWVAAGFWFDCIHALGNLAAGSLILPLSALLKRLDGGRAAK